MQKAELIGLEFNGDENTPESRAGNHDNPAYLSYFMARSHAQSNDLNNKR